MSIADAPTERLRTIEAELKAGGVTPVRKNQLLDTVVQMEQDLLSIISDREAEVKEYQELRERLLSTEATYDTA